jgi:chromosome segregation ATPase
MEALRRTIETRDEENEDSEQLRREIRELEGIIGEKNEALEQFAAMEEDFDEMRALLQEKQAALEESESRHGADLSELDNQWRTSLTQAEDRIQLLEEDLSDMEERWRNTDQQLAEKAAEADTLRDEIEQVSRFFRVNMECLKVILSLIAR